MKKQHQLILPVPLVQAQAPQHQLAPQDRLQVLAQAHLDPLPALDRLRALVQVLPDRLQALAQAHPDPLPALDHLRALVQVPLDHLQALAQAHLDPLPALDQHQALAQVQVHLVQVPELQILQVIKKRKLFQL